MTRPPLSRAPRRTSASATAIPVTFAIAAALSAPASVHAQTCAEPAMSSFRTDTLIAPTAGNPIAESGNYGAVAMSIAPDGRVFVAMMNSGAVQVWHPGSGAVENAGVVDVYANNEEGLLGIAVSPDFATTGWVYVLHTDPNTGGANRGHRVARYTYNGNLAAGSRLTNRKEILFFTRNSIYHAAGNLDFGRDGVLVIGTGDDTNPHDATNAGFGPLNTATLIADGQRTSANTNDLRGKILRIKPIAFADNQTPTPGEGGTYTIPAGNLWEKINNPAYHPRWNASEDDLTKVRKEIFVMGTRNPFHPRVDTRSGWIFWGDVGPDAGSDSPYRGRTGHDEWNLVTSAGNTGYPYCRGYNYAYAERIGNGTSQSAFGKFYDCDNTGDTTLTPLRNLSPNNTGITNLPRSVPALAAYSSGNTSGNDPRFNISYHLTNVQHSSESAIGGPMYRYDLALNSPGKFPAYYEGKVFFFDWARRNFRVIALDSNGTIPDGAAGVSNFAPQGWQQASYLDMQFGPDGMLYALRNSANNYSGGTGGLFRVRYTGAHDDACYRPFDVRDDLLGPGATQNGTSIRPAIRRTVPNLVSDGFVTLPAGYRTLTLHAVDGRTVWTYRRAESAEGARIQLPAHLARGAWRARLEP